MLSPKNYTTMLHVFKITDLCVVTYSQSGKSSRLRTTCSVWRMAPVADIVTGTVYTTSRGAVFSLKCLILHVLLFFRYTQFANQLNLIH